MRVETMNLSIKNKYKHVLSLARAKVNDLLRLCTNKVIPKVYHPFYMELSAGDQRDKLNEPDNDDDEYYCYIKDFDFF